MGEGGVRLNVSCRNGAGLKPEAPPKAGPPNPLDEPKSETETGFILLQPASVALGFGPAVASSPENGFAVFATGSLRPLAEANGSNPRVVAELGVENPESSLNSFILSFCALIHSGEDLLSPVPKISDTVP